MTSSMTSDGTTPRIGRALDLSTGVGDAYTTKLLAEMGWDVVKVERASGDALRSMESRWGGGAGGAFTFVHQGKRSVVADDATVLRLAAAADVVVGDFSKRGLQTQGRDVTFFEQLRPEHVLASVAPFGRSGPDADLPATEIVMQAASGVMFLTGEWDQPPMQLPPYQAELTGGLAAAGAVLAARRVARRTGERQDVDVSMTEALSSHLYGSLSGYAMRGEVPRREARIKGGLRMVPASDGFVYCAAGAIASMRMDGIAQLLDEPQLAEERFQTAEGRMRHYDEFLELFVPPFKRKPAAEWFVEAERLHMTFALVQTIDELFGCPQLEARALLRESSVGGKTLALAGRPFGMGKPALPLQPMGEPGGDSDTVIREWLG